MKQYKIGDKVTIRRLKDLKCEFMVDSVRQLYGGDYIRNDRHQGILCEPMEKYTGLETKIAYDACGGYYYCEIDGSFRFNASLFEE